MKELNEILAKSANYGSVTLLERTEQVVKAITLFANKYAFNFNIALAIKGAIFHDLGKAHPHFQRKIAKINGSNLSEEREWNYIHRHELSSLAFLPCFKQNEWEPIIDMVVAHHKSIENDPSNRGVLDLVENDRNFIENHLRNWEDWRKYPIEIIRHFGFEVNEISKESAKNALNYVIDYCESKKNGFSPLRGLLKSADHFASAFMHDTEKELISLFEIPDLSFYRDDSRVSELYPLSKISTDDQRKHTLVVASTGSGKTDFLLRRCKGRIFYTLPFQASINAMWERFKVTIYIAQY